MRRPGRIFLTLLWVVLVGCDPAEPPPTAGDSMDLGADQVLFGVRLTITADGVLRARLEADTAFQFDSQQESELRGVTVHFFNALGEETSTLTSDEGTYYWRNDNMESRGNVVATGENGGVLRTELLQYDKFQDKIEGPTSFVYDGPDQYLEGDSFISDPDFENVEAQRPRGEIRSLEP